MTFNIAINVMPLKDLLDPQGKAVLAGLHNLGINNAQDCLLYTSDAADE